MLLQKNLVLCVVCRKNCAYGVVQKLDPSPPAASVLARRTAKVAGSPSWHRRQRRARSSARGLLLAAPVVPTRTTTAAARLLACHHGSDAPRKFNTPDLSAGIMAPRSLWLCGGCGWSHPTVHKVCTWCVKTTAQSAACAPKPEAWPANQTATPKQKRSRSATKPPNAKRTWSAPEEWEEPETLAPVSPYVPDITDDA